MICIMTVILGGNTHLWCVLIRRDYVGWLRVLEASPVDYLPTCVKL